MRHNIDAAMLNVDITHNTIDTCAVSSTSTTHNQCQVLLLQLQAIKNLLMSVETSLGHHLVTQFLENEKAATIDNVIREYAEGADS
tara:strand:+ start:1171 stop:1428 length:258 start_codon:yes stop_codon:yes gene_type:complete